jgi:uncharacterized iron-regulated protein
MFRPFLTHQLLSRLVLPAGFLVFVLTAHALPSEPAGAEPQAANHSASQEVPGAYENADPETKVLDLSALGEFDGLIDRLADDRVIFVGESHDRYEDHLNQLAIIRGLRERGAELAIGMEFFQQPFQDRLDAYIAGTLSEEDLLRETEYFERWRFDYRLYRPILRYAKEHGIPLIALNVPREITDKVGDNGIASLSAEESAQIPSEIDRDDEDYRAHIKMVFDMHPKDDEASFEHFLEVQLLWDEGMAERAADWLAANPGKQLIVLAGSGHVEYGRGIPSRLKRRQDVPFSIVMSGQQRGLDPAMADFLLFPKPVELPKTGLIGVMLDTESEGEGIAIEGFAQKSDAREVGVKEGDRIVKIGEIPIDSYADIRIALIDSEPGQQLPLEVLRKPLVGDAERLSFDVTLQ